MTCPSCKGEFSMDEQSTYAVCPWCGHLIAPASTPSPKAGSHE